MSSSLQHAETLIKKGYAIIPLKKNEKGNTDPEIIKRDYTLDHFKEPLLHPEKGYAMWDVDGNQGINLEKNKWIDLDLENKYSVHFGKLWLPDTLSLGRILTNADREITHYFYKNNKDLATLTLDTSIAEFRCEGQTVVFGKTKCKKTGDLLERYWGRTIDPADAPHDIEEIFNEISFFSWLASLPFVWENANTGALKLDACFKRYTEWSDEKRIQRLMDFFSYKLPHGHRDLKVSKMQRLVKCNNQETKNVGYTALSKVVGVDVLAMKEKMHWIGTIEGDNGYAKTPSRRDFLAKGIDMKKLMVKEIPPLKFAVQSILPEGLILIAGRPKAMKSWTMLDLCYRVENGIKFLNHDVVQGNALYLSLEDSERRLKDRVYKLGHAFKPNHPTTDVEAPYLSYGLEEDLQQWIDHVPNPRLVVIDTLARVKPKQGKSSGTAYDLDNELLRKIQKLAISNGVCIALVSHLSKTTTDYSFDRITGSAGLQGMTDAMWLMDRGDTNNGKATICGRGRDIHDFEYSVKWNDDTWCYDWVGNKTEIDLNENRASIKNAMTILYMEDPIKNEAVKPSQVYKYLDYKANSKDAKNISRTMLRMKESFEISGGSKFGTYCLNNNKKEEVVPF